MPSRNWFKVICSLLLWKEEVTGSIEIIPAFWQTSIFRLLVILTATGLIIKLAHLRIRGIRKKKNK
ncbi:MAG: hypothetical protein BGP13_01000 [Sphingobacteriales bacterium 40-81]|nr:MAG: hypothetical protein BGP13_01000 [Sphingobacteriales bacterium 40-81]